MEKNDIGILIVDDEPAIRNSLYSWFKKDGYRTDKAADAGEALTKLSTSSWEIILLDIKMPGISGIELLKRIRESNPDTLIIMITAYATIETAVETLKEGAFDYVSKPIDPDQLSLIVRRATEQLKLKGEETPSQRTIEELSMKEHLIGESPPIKKVLELINVVSRTDVSVMITGERGTGKELIAGMIHANSSRKFFPLIPVSCGSLGESLIESELFGNEKVTFIGTQPLCKGKLEMANGGTLFLDEIGAIGAKLQERLLGVLKTKTITRPGEGQVVPADCRIISASSQDLELLVKEGLFKEELYHFVNVFQINIPPLCERRTDIPLLAEFFADKYSKALDRKIKKISKKAIDTMMEYDWPGNVRELENAIERAIVISKEPKIEPEDLPSQLKSGDSLPRNDSLEMIEKEHIIEILDKTSWNISRAAKRLGVDRATLYNKIRKYKLNK